jgi:hypothetical protein
MGTRDALGPGMTNHNKSHLTKTAALFFALFAGLCVALLAGSMSGCAVEEEEQNYLPPNISLEVCCDCACSDGADICLNLLERAPAGSSCNTVCEVECSEQDECTEVGDAQVCAAAPPQPCADVAIGDEGDDTQPCA